MASVFLRGRTWWGKYKLWTGEWKSISTGERDAQRAREFIAMLERKEQDKRHAVRMGLVDPCDVDSIDLGRTSIDTAREAFLRTIASPANRAEAAGVLAAFVQAARIDSAAAFGSRALVAKVRDFLDRAIAAGVTREWAAKQRAHIVRFGTWMEDGGYIAASHARRARVTGGSDRGASTRARPHRALTPAEAERLTTEQVNLWTIAAGGSDDSVPEIRRLFYRARIWTGLRGEEALRIERRDLEYGREGEALLHVRRDVAKNGLECWLPLAPAIANDLRTRFAMAHPNARLFSALPAKRWSLERLLQQDLAAAGVDLAGVNARSFRMTFVSFLEAAGVELGARMKLRRDRGRGSERLTNWTYSDWRLTWPVLRDALVRAETWYADELRRQPARAGAAS